METLYGLSNEESLKLLNVGHQLFSKLGYDKTKPGVAVNMQVSLYLQALAMDALLENSVHAGHQVPKSGTAAASDIRHPVLRYLKRCLRRNPTADDLLERITPHCEISAEAAAVIKQDVERLAAALP